MTRFQPSHNESQSGQYDGDSGYDPIPVESRWAAMHHILVIMTFDAGCDSASAGSHRITTSHNVAKINGDSGRGSLPDESQRVTTWSILVDDRSRRANM